MKKEKIEFVKAGQKSKRLFEDKGAVTDFKKSSKGMGKLRLHPHEAYEEELEERTN